MHRRSLLTALGLVAVLLAAAGCQGGGRVGGGGPPRAADGTRAHSIVVDGRERTYRVHVPTSGGEGLPVLVVLHGGGGNGALTEEQTGFDRLADEAGFLVVYPDGTGRSADRLLTWNAGDCCGYAHDNDVDDVTFIDAMLDELAARYPIDPARIGVTGLSNGAMMSYRIACELSGRVAAVAAVAGAMNLDSCAPDHPVPLLVIHGTADENVPYGGGRSDGRGARSQDGRVDRPVSYAVRFWAEHNRCDPLPELDGDDGAVRPGTVGPGGAWVPDPSTVPDGAVVRTRYAGCAEGAEVVLYTVGGGGHAWPGGTRIRRGGDEPPPAPDATRLIWEFLDSHR